MSKRPRQTASQAAKNASRIAAPKSRTPLPDARRSPRFAGIPTFCRYPRIEDAQPSGTPIDWAIYGAPYDGGTTYRPGTRFGPRAIRNESQYVKRYSIEHDVDVTEALSIVDAGDTPVSPYSCEQNAQTQLAFCRALLSEHRSARLMAIGGDHTIAYANLLATHEHHAARKSKQGLALIHFDSHLDTIDAVWGERWGHASVFRRAIEAGAVDPKAMLSIGIKGPLNTRDDLTYARDHGVTVLTCEQFRDRGAAAIGAFLKRVRGRPVYVTFDIDCIDPAFAPGTGTPSVGGLTSAEALKAIRSLAGIDLVGADVVEVLPDRDPGGITALLAGHIMFELLCLSAIRPR